MRRKELLAYPWPGNVRQLKNITEQISIIETNREISAAILRNIFLHKIQHLPALMGTREYLRADRGDSFILFCSICAESGGRKKDGAQPDGGTCRTGGAGDKWNGQFTTPVVTLHQPSYLRSFIPCSLRFARMMTT